MGWTTHVYEGFKQTSVETQCFYTNQLDFKHNILKVINKLGVDLKPQVSQLEMIIKKFKPTVAFFVGVFFLPLELAAVCKEHNIATAAWAGDSFGIEQESFKEYIDYLYVSDSAMLSKAQEIGFDNYELLQFGFNSMLHKDYNLKRDNYINFIGSYTKERDEIFSNLADYNLRIEGIKWDKLKCSSDKWIVRNRKLDQQEVVKIYNSTIATLNVAQKTNVVNTVNMRTFEAIACGSCILNDYVKDIELCFEPGKEILVYNNEDELLELTQKILSDDKFVKNIVNNGKLRMQKSDYTYKNRANQILSKIG